MPSIILANTSTIELNMASMAEVSLLQLRLLMSTDGMTQQYELYKLQTLRNILDLCHDLTKDENPNVYNEWPSELKLEFMSAMNEIRTYITNLSDDAE